MPDPLDETRVDTTGAQLFELLCERRGWTPEYLTRVEDSSHAPLMDVDTMVAELDRARREGLRVSIIPDFDMDGIASGVLGLAGLSELGLTVGLHLPDYRRGHDVSPQDIAEVNARWPDTRVVLTCDGGVNSSRGLATARSLGWRVLVTDHHEELEPGCVADVTVDPCRLDETYAHPGICGAHVLWQVLDAYARAHRPDKLWEVHLLRLFAGLGTVSDVMPLLFENRDLVRDAVAIANLLRVRAPETVPNQWGGMDADPDAIDVADSTLLRLLAADGSHHPAFVATFRGFALVLKAFARAGKLRNDSELGEDFFGFYVAPAFNSPRRAETPLEPCFTVFTDPDPTVQLSAMDEVIAANERRRAMVSVHLEELERTDQPFAPFVWFSSAPTGMFGLLANSIMTRLGHPVVVGGLGRRFSGSGRAPTWFGFLDALNHVPGMQAIGHQQACGVQASSPESLSALLAEATAVAMLERDTSARSGDIVLGHGPGVDAQPEDTEALLGFVEQVEALRPFGQGFEAPTAEIVLDPRLTRVRRIGSQQQHLAVDTDAGLTCLWWNAADQWFDELSRVSQGSDPMRLLTRLQVNEFRGQRRVQAVVDRWLPS